MFTKILVAIDGSEVSKRALSIAVDEARVWGSELNAIYVIETGMLSSIPVDNTMEIIYTLLENEGKETLEYCKSAADKEGVSVVQYIKQGHAGNEILKLSDELEADVIILGSQGKSEIDRILLGSVTDYVVRHNRITTMVVR